SVKPTSIPNLQGGGTGAGTRTLGTGGGCWAEVVVAQPPSSANAAVPTASDRATLVIGAGKVGPTRAGR
ncbi:MAG TPA: hypothetical protein VNL98_09695, partial [Gemmatimonadales bacterium]|nr:hypothetical protein [Gemmatimonadales bacterium]